MGYYTYFTLKIEADPLILTEIENYIEMEDEDSYISDIYSGNGEPCKWYDYEDDMRAISREFPSALFILTGEGEENDDLWKAYFRDGKAQLVPASITYDKFDSKKLK